MIRKLKVYVWQSVRFECPTHHRTTREIVAVTSKKEAALAAGFDKPTQMFNLCETRNPGEITQAMSEPGVVFWRPIDGKGDWTRAPKKIQPLKENE